MAARETQDRAVRFQSPGGALTGMLHLPAGEAPRAAGVFCNPFGDERKASCLAAARLARALARRGMAVLRFDYQGCGDSPGEFADASVTTRLRDIGAAARCVRAESALSGVWLMGLRLGATLAAGAAERLEGCAGLILIEPVGDGSAYFSTQLKRKRVRQMITSGRGQAGSEQDVIDLDGYAVRRATLDEMQRLRIRAGEVSFRGRVLHVQVSFSKTIRPEGRAVCEAYEAAGAQVDSSVLVMAPFWSRIDITDTTPLEEAVVGWLDAITGGQGGSGAQQPASPDR